MRYELATKKQLMNIIENDKDIPAHLLAGVALEMIKRNMWDGIIFYSARKAYRNYTYVMENILKIDNEELIQIAHIEIMKMVDSFKPGMRNGKSYMIMCLIGKFSVLLQNAKAKKRKSELNTVDVDTLPVDWLQSSMNVENYVINKLMIEDAWNVLREVEKRAIILELMGYTQKELSEMIGYTCKSSMLLHRAYAKLRKAMVA